jgi:hypothetical protein
MRDRFIELIERLVNRKVVSFISGVDAATETSADLFVLESSASDLTGRLDPALSPGAPAEAAEPERPRRREARASPRVA